MRIVQFDNKYRDDMIFMILEAKNALGRVPGLNEDLLDIKKNYLDKGDMFWLALDDNDRVMEKCGMKYVRTSTAQKKFGSDEQCEVKCYEIGGQ